MGHWLGPDDEVFLSLLGFRAGAEVNGGRTALPPSWLSDSMLECGKLPQLPNPGYRSDLKGKVLGLGIGCFGVFSAGFNDAFTWTATTTSRPKRSLACSAQGSAACGAMRPFSPGATSSWIAAASSLVRSHPPPAPRVRVATPILTSRTTTSFTPSPRTPGAVFTPV